MENKILYYENIFLNKNFGEVFFLLWQQSQIRALGSPKPDLIFVHIIYHNINMSSRNINEVVSFE